MEILEGNITAIKTLPKAMYLRLIVSSLVWVQVLKYNFKTRKLETPHEAVIENPW